MKKLCKDQREGLIAKLTAFFKGLEPEEIDDVVTVAKKQANTETIEEKKNGFAELFLKQLETLKSRGVPAAIIEVLSGQKDQVISIATSMDIAEKHLPFVPVIPKAYLGIYGLMPLVRHGDKVGGYTHLDPNLIKDVVETPKNPYYIFDVEDGKDLLGKSPKDAEKMIKGDNRSPLTDAEGIALCVHKPVLSEHYMDCTGSRYGGDDGVPFVYLNDGEPKLHWSSFGNSDGRWGSASCRSRF